MSNFEMNKVFAAVLCAGIAVMFAGFIANIAVHPEPLEKDAITIEGGAAAGSHGGGAAAPEIAEPILGLIASADIEKGAKISKACAACHSFDNGGPVKQGPNLWNSVNRAKGSAAGFDYSAGLKEKGGNWDYDSLNQFLWKPKKFIGDTKMNFAGIKKPEDRAALIAWLRQQADAPAGLPSEGDIAAEAAASAAPPVTEEAAPAAEGEAPEATAEEGGESAPAEGERAPATEETPAE